MWKSVGLRNHMSTVKSIEICWWHDNRRVEIHLEDLVAVTPCSPEDFWGDDGTAILPPRYTSVESKMGSLQDGHSLSVEGVMTIYSLRLYWHFAWFWCFGFQTSRSTEFNSEALSRILWGVRRRHNFHQWRDGQTLQDAAVASWFGETFSQKVPGSVFRSWVHWSRNIYKLNGNWFEMERKQSAGAFEEQEDHFGTCFQPHDAALDHLPFLVRPLRYLDCSACRLDLSVL